MGEVEGALAIGQIRKLDRFNAVRRKIAAYYFEKLKGIKGLGLPYISPDVTTSNYLFVCVLENPKISLDDVIDAMNSELGFTSNVNTLEQVFVNLAQPLYLQPVFSERKGLGRTQWPFSCPLCGRGETYEKGLCPNAEELTKRGFFVPINHAMSLDDAEDVVAAIRTAFSTLQEKEKAPTLRTNSRRSMERNHN